MTVSPDPRCTGVAARFCPVHGDCSCRHDRDLNDQTCDLHADESSHAMPWPELYLPGMRVDVRESHLTDWLPATVVDRGSTGIVIRFADGVAGATDVGREPLYVTDPALIREKDRP